jgi:hypothetical protein
MSNPTVRAKFICQSKIPSGSQTTVFLSAVYSNKDGSRAEENKAFSDATPSGMVQISIANDKPALQQFEVGQAYYIDFTPVEA